jgi:hypothetical protein
MPDTTLDTRRLARENESNLADATNVGFNLLKPYMQFNAAGLRFYADACSSMVSNFEKIADSWISTIENQQSNTSSTINRGQQGRQEQGRSDRPTG